MADGEPEENISAETAATDEPWEDVVPRTRAEAVVDRLGTLYWRKTYGGKAAFPCLVRTILSQHTSDKASQPAYDALLEHLEGADDLAVALAEADREAVAEHIRPAGLYNRKTEVLQAVAQTVLDEWGSAAAFDRAVTEGDPAAVREVLLEWPGVGPKTADCVLLFAGGNDGVFPVDTHVHRIARRLGIAPASVDHAGVRTALEAAVPPAKCGFGHTAMIQFGREYCTARTPACLDEPDACPLFEHCDRVGVDLETGTVVDPATAVSDD